MTPLLPPEASTTRPSRTGPSQGPPCRSLAANRRIERAAPADLAALVSLEQQCFDNRVAISQRQFRYLLRQPTAEIWVCRERGRVIADAVILFRRTPRGLLGRLYSLVVAPEARGRGVGRRLLQTCLERCRKRHAYATVLEVAADNQPALALYEEEGFETRARITGYYAGRTPALRMRRPIIATRAALGRAGPSR